MEVLGKVVFTSMLKMRNGITEKLRDMADIVLLVRRIRMKIPKSPTPPAPSDSSFKEAHHQKVCAPPSYESLDQTDLPAESSLILKYSRLSVTQPPRGWGDAG